MNLGIRVRGHIFKLTILWSELELLKNLENRLPGCDLQNKHSKFYFCNNFVSFLHMACISPVRCNKKALSESRNYAQFSLDLEIKTKFWIYNSQPLLFEIYVCLYPTLQITKRTTFNPIKLA